MSTPSEIIATETIHLLLYYEKQICAPLDLELDYALVRVFLLLVLLEYLPCIQQLQC